MRILALDSAVARCSATIVTDAEVVAGFQLDLDRGHASVLPVMAQDCLRDAGIDATDLDLIAVCTPTDLHHEQTLAALRAGKHVLCEKPVALDTAQAREMLEEARATGADVVVASRYARGGSYAGLSGPVRRAVSVGTKRLAQVVFKEARKTSDPLAGFFLLKTSAISGIQFRPTGFKILLEILVCVSRNDSRITSASIFRRTILLT